MQTGLCRTRTGSLAAALAAHREMGHRNLFLGPHVIDAASSRA
jgi:hypothetical protein